MCLSDAFEKRKEEADVELKVRVLNINHGHNRELMGKCGVLEEYARFVAVSRTVALKWQIMRSWQCFIYQVL